MTALTNARFLLRRRPCTLARRLCALALVKGHSIVQSHGVSVGTLALSLRYFHRPQLPSFGIAPTPIANFPTEAHESKKGLNSQWLQHLIHQPWRLTDAGPGTSVYLLLGSRI